MPLLTSGDVLRIGPSRNNVDGMKSLHLIHPALFRLRSFGAVETAFKRQESKELGGDRMYYPIGLPTAKWNIPYSCIEAMNSVFEFVGFTYLNKPVTIRTWTGFEFLNFSATMHYDPDDDLKRDNFEEKFDIVIEFYDLVEIV